MSKPITLSSCQWRLAAVWLGGSVVLFAVLLIQSAGGIYGAEFGKAWSDWLLPSVVPTLSMIFGAIGYQVTHAESKITVYPGTYRVTVWLSIAYFAVLLLTVGVLPMAWAHLATTPLDWLAGSKAWVAPLNSIIAVTLGAFFVSSKHEEGARTTG